MGDFAKKKWKENLNYQREKSTAHMVDSWQVLHGKTLKVLPFREGARQRFHYCHLNSAQSKVRNYKLRLLNKFETLKGLHPQGKGIQRKVYSLAQRNQEKYLPLYLNERKSLPQKFIAMDLLYMQSSNLYYPCGPGTPKSELGIQIGPGPVTPLGHQAKANTKPLLRDMSSTQVIEDSQR